MDMMVVFDVSNLPKIAFSSIILQQLTLQITGHHVGD
jgi:hypothetical protein